MRKHAIDIHANTMLAEECERYLRSGRLGSAFEVSGKEVALMLAEPEDVLPKGGLAALGVYPPDGDAGWQELDEFGLPKAHDYEGPRFTVLDYGSDEYAQAKSLDEAINLRGFKAFVDKVTPSDFADDAPGVRKVGIAHLWSQSTWESGFEDRDVEHELEALTVEVGDLLTVMPLDYGLTHGDDQDGLEVRDQGFAFFKGETMLPYTLYHDYDQSLVFDALLTLDEGQLLAFLVLDNDCTGGDGVPGDEHFCWRVYTPTVEVLKLDAAAQAPERP